MMNSWLSIPANSDFPLENIPFGAGVLSGTQQVVALTRIGDSAIDLSALQAAGVFMGLDLPEDIFSRGTLNDFMALGRGVARQVRERIQSVYSDTTHENLHEAAKAAAHAADSVRMVMPIAVGDYTDFYSSKEHATNIGTMLRDPNNALMPNWLHLPVAYHGRASSILISGTSIRRPKGQTDPSEGAVQANFGPTKLLDFELEMAFVLCKGNEIGTSIAVNEAEDHIFGMVLFNDWSARDIQKWEYVPLGPFLAKNFASSISPWIVTLDALEPFRTASPKADIPVLPYLDYQGEGSFDINLEVFIKPEQGEETKVCTSNHKYLYWNIAQQLAHHTVNGCNMRVGDMCASGTISGPTPDSFGSMMEITWRGARPVRLADGTERKFINDGDTVIMRGYAQKNGLRVGFGEVSTFVTPAR